MAKRKPQPRMRTRAAPVDPEPFRALLVPCGWCGCRVLAQGVLYPEHVFCLNCHPVTLWEPGEFFCLLVEDTVPPTSDPAFRHHVRVLDAPPRELPFAAMKPVNSCPVEWAPFQP